MANLRKTKRGFTRPSIAAVVFVAALLSANSGAFAQDAQPGPGPTVSPGPTPGPGPTVKPGPTVSPAPSSQSSTEEIPRTWPEPGRYHPCPASVDFGNGRSVCLGVDEPRRHVRHVHVASYGHYVPGGYGYYDFGPCRHCAAQRFYQSIEALTGCPVGFSMTYGACWPHTWPHAPGVFAPFGG
jgi:hypothetical protein